MRIFEDLNNERFLKEAFDPKLNATLTKSAMIRRNIYLILFVVGIICLFVTALSKLIPLCILSLGLATLSLVIMTKYDTQVYFLKTIQKREQEGQQEEVY